MLIRNINQLGKELSGSIYLDILFSNNDLHPRLNKVLGYYIHSIKENKWWYINISHNELPFLNINEIHEFLTDYPFDIITLDKKVLMYFFTNDNIFDLRIENREDYDFEPINTLNINKKYLHSKSLNQFIPITKHIQYFKYKFDTIKDNIKCYKYDKFNSDYIKAFYELEKVGMNISESILEKYFTKSIKDYSIYKNRLYSVYNLYNPSLRPTMNFNNFNLLNLSKNSDVRELIQSNNGYIFNYDYKGFHLSILCNLINYTLKYDNVYLELYNQIYEPVVELNSEQYELIKKEFFQIFFSKKMEYEKSSELLDKIFEFKKSLLYKFDEYNYIESPITNKIYFHKTYTSDNVFSIFFRIIETELNVSVLLKLQEYLKEKKTKLILYQYDSFLFDWNEDDGKEVLRDIKKILTYKPYNLSITYGTSFGNLKKIKK